MKNYRIANLKLTRHIAFFLAIIVLMGHDAIPHFHVDKNDLHENFTTIPQPFADDFADLQKLFSNFQHPTAKHTLVYLGSSEKATDLQKKTFYNAPFLFVMEYRTAWYANYKKHRFREYIVIPFSFKSKYSSLRGPPAENLLVFEQAVIIV
ncbi:MAG: hypothetical protein ACYCZO_11910 [Daejeonella sp.]